MFRLEKGWGASGSRIPGRKKKAIDYVTHFEKVYQENIKQGRSLSEIQKKKERKKKAKLMSASTKRKSSTT